MKEPEQLELFETPIQALHHYAAEQAKLAQERRDRTYEAAAHELFPG